MTDYGYARVSSGEQNLGLQLSAFRDAGIDEANVFVDTITGKSRARPGRDELLGKVVAGDRITVWRLDRWGRLAGPVLVSLDDLTHQGVTFRSLKEGIDLSTAMGKFLAAQLAVFAQLERDMIADRTRAGLAEARRNGKKLGRPTKVKPDQVPWIVALAQAGHTNKAIASRTGLSPSTVARVIAGQNAAVADLPRILPPGERMLVDEPSRRRRGSARIAAAGGATRAGDGT